MKVPVSRKINKQACACPVKYRMQHTVEPLSKGHFRANSFFPCREVVPISEVNISMVPQQVSLVERSSLFQRVPYQRFHCSCLSLSQEHSMSISWKCEHA